MSTSTNPNWEEEPDEVLPCKTHIGITVDKYWRNTETGEVLVAYHTTSPTGGSHNLERHTETEHGRDWLYFLANLARPFTDIRYEWDTVRVTAGHLLVSSGSWSEVAKTIERYQNGTLDHPIHDTP